MQVPRLSGSRLPPGAVRPEVEPCPPAEDLDELYRRLAPSVSRWAERLGGPDLDLEDVVHDVFIIVQRRLPSFRGESRIETWLYGITARVVMHRLRARRWRRLFLPLATSPRDHVVDVADERPTPPEELQRRQANERIYRLLDRLSEKYREAIILFELEGLSGPEIAEVTGASLATVWARLSRGRQKLARALAEERAR
jgi:RNA polymerase sigma-70 factor (ECF subfamily)